LPLLAKDRSRHWLVEAIHESRDKWPVDLWAWVIMPEHVHLLIAPRHANVEIGRFQGKIKEQVARQAIEWLCVHAPQWIPRITVQEKTRTRRRFWQPGGGYDRNVTEMATLQRILDYIHANPVKRGLVARPEDWEWSSAREYAGDRDVRLKVDRTLPIFDTSDD